MADANAGSSAGFTGTGFAQPNGRSEERQEQGPDRIDVRDRVQGEPAEARRRVVAEPPGGPGMEELVERQGEQEHDEVHHPLEDEGVIQR